MLSVEELGIRLYWYYVRNYRAEYPNYTTHLISLLTQPGGKFRECIKGWDVSLFIINLQNKGFRLHLKHTKGGRQKFTA